MVYAVTLGSLETSVLDSNMPVPCGRVKVKHSCICSTIQCDGAVVRL